MRAITGIAHAPGRVVARPAAPEYPGARPGRRRDRRGQHGAGGGALLAGSHGRHGHPDGYDHGRGDEDRREHFPRPPDRGGEPARPPL